MTAAPLNVPLPASGHAAILPRLSVMMFFQFAIQGAWLPLLFPFFNEYRNFSEGAVAALFTAAAVGAIVSPFVAGQLADRYMNAERFMAVAHIVGAVFVWLFAYVTDFYVLVGFSFLYAVLYTPTLGVANAICFAHLPDRDRDFGKVRVWGTVGWIVVGIAIGQWLFRQAGTVRAAQLQSMGDAFRLAAILGVVQGLYALTLPKTPPRRENKNYAPGEALKEIRRQPLVTIFLLSIPIAAVHQFFFVRTSQYLGQLNLNAPIVDKIFGVGGAGVMTIGQISELVVLALMPLIVKRVPRKTILTVGLLAYTLRFLAFAYLPYAWALLPALALHGLVFGCFFFVCFMIVDEYTTKDVRSSAQNLFSLVVFGLGVIVGNILVGLLSAWTKVGETTNWQAYYAIPAWITLACLVLLLIFYPNRGKLADRSSGAVG
jgi:nucleoside transporter